MKRPIIIIISVIGIFLLLGVSVMRLFGPKYGSTFSYVTNDLGYGGGAAATEAPAAMEAPMPATDGFASEELARQSTSNSVQTQERLVIKNADLAILVKDPQARMKEISDMAVEMGGFVVSSNLYQSYYGPNSIEVPEATVAIRVPSERLAEALTKIKEGSSDVQYENISGQDVTSQYVDVQSQLKAKQAAEKKLLEILDGAVKTEDVLAVYQQLQFIQSEIEVLKGQIKYYEESAALSAVSVRLIAEETVQPVEIGGWKLQGTANDAVQDLIVFTQGLTRFLIRFVLFNLPALILIAIPLYGAFVGGRALFRRFGKSKVKVEEKVEEEVKK